MIYAKQVPPEYQESPLFIDECFPEDVICDGNRQYKSRTTEPYDMIMGRAYELSDELDSIGAECGYYATAEEAINDMLPPCYDHIYSDVEIDRWKELLKKCNPINNNKQVICDMLDLLTGNKYDYSTIRGCCQSDWQYIFYPSKLGDEFVKVFETEYFNLGSEWIVCESDGDTEDDVDSFSCYLMSSGYDEKETKQELSEITGTDPSDIVLYRFTGWKRTAEYEAV